MTDVYTKQLEEQVAALEELLEDNNKDLDATINYSDTSARIVINIINELDIHLRDIQFHTNELGVISQEGEIAVGKLMTILDSISPQHTDDLILEVLNEIANNFSEPIETLSDAIRSPSVHWLHDESSVRLRDLMPRIEKIVNERYQ